MKELLKKALTEGNLEEYKSIPFWSWNNTLDEDELIKQIDEMHSVGIGGFIMHARTGLKDEYLGEKWFSCVGKCLKRARELNMQAWVYDENGWPSGFVGGKLLENEDFRARFLEYKVGGFDKTAFAVFVAKGDDYYRVERPVDGVGEYHNIYLRISPANTDILNPKVTDAFIAETHEKYYERFSESFGKELIGFFTDEPQYYRWATPYTPCVDDIFAENGEDVRDGLIRLFIHGEKGYTFRLKYYGALNYLYVNNFYKKIKDWCDAHGCMLTGHSIEESNLAMQMWGGADVMTSYADEHIPAIDHLGRRCMGEIGPRQVASVSAQLGKKIILTETYACSGNDVTPYELKSIGDAQYFLGVNKTCQHLYPYSMARGGKTDHPPVFSPHGNWFEGFKTFNKYFNRLGYIIGETEETVDALIIHPIRNIWLNYVQSEPDAGVETEERTFAALLGTLRKDGVKYHFADETILKKHGKVEGDSLIIGKRAYKTVIVPEMCTIASETYDLLRKFSGKLCVLKVPEFVDGKKTQVKLMGNTALREIANNATVKFSCEDEHSIISQRKGEVGEFIFVKNLSYDKPSIVKFVGVAENYRLLDLVTLTESDIKNQITLRPSEGIVLVKDGQACVRNAESSRKDVTDKFKVVGISKNYLVMDYAAIARGNGEFSDMQPIYGLFEGLLHDDYSGKITVRQQFTLNEKIPLTFIMEKAKLLSVSVNGNDVKFGRSAFDVNFVETDISDKVVIGINVIEYSLDFYQHDGVHFALFDPLATESVRNCLYFDTSIETSYLRGDFVVNEDFSLSARKKLPAVTDLLYGQGYPFFKGKLTLEGEIEKNSFGRTIIELGGRFMTAEVRVGDKIKTIVLDNKADITDILSDGKNKVTLTLNSSIRNLFGPHHFKPEKEPIVVSPYNFEFRGKWSNGKIPDDYTHEYRLVPFGVNKICIIKE